jgi:hypothetical protein
VGGVGHGLGATGDDDGGGAEHDVLSTKDDGLQGGGADLVDGGGDGGLGEASTNGTLAGRTLAKAGEEGMLALMRWRG